MKKLYFCQTQLYFFQTQLLPSKPGELKKEHLVWCYNSADGVRGIEGKVLKKPKVVSSESIV